LCCSAMSLQLNVQRNRGLPIFFYKYMRQYRGW
jgi:hypothetical protein